MNRKCISSLGLLVALVALICLWAPDGARKDSSVGRSDSMPHARAGYTLSTDGTVDSSPSHSGPKTETSWRPPDVFSKVGVPTPARIYPRGENGSRRYHEVVTHEVDSALSARRPAVLAMMPEDGRVDLLPEEIDDHTLRAVRLIFDPLALDQIVQGKTSRILVPTPGDEVLTLEFNRIKTRAVHTHTLQGHVLGDENMSIAQVVYHDGIIHGSVIRYDTGQELEYRILSDGHMVVRELDHAGMTGTCATCSGHEMADLTGEGFIEDPNGYTIKSSEEPSTLDTSGWRTLDVVAGYGSEARIADGGYAQIEARIIDTVDRMTLAFANSGIADSEVMLLGTIEDPDYLYSDSSANNMGSEISALRTLNGSDGGSLDTVTDFADQLGADVITFTIKSNRGSTAGVASPGSGITGRYAIVARTGMTIGQMTYAHEIGHLLGCTHAWGDTNNNVDNSRYAWRYTSPVSGNRYRTITAYNEGIGGSKIPYWSNPNISFDGAPTGAPDGYNVAADPNEPGDPLFYEEVVQGIPIRGFDGTNPDLGANNAEVIDVGDFVLGHGLDFNIARATRTSFEVINPTVDSRWEKGTTPVVQFNGGDMEDLVTISLYKGGVLDTVLASDVNPVTNRNYAWTVPYNQAAGADYMIRVELDRNGSTSFADSGIFEIYSELPHVIAESAPAIPAGIGVISSLELSFNVPMDPSTFAVADDIGSFTDPVGTSVLSSITGSSWSNENTVLTIAFTPPSQPGTYQMVIGPDIQDLLGNPMDQDRDGTTGESVDDRHTVQIEINPPLAYYANMDVNPNWTFSANNPADGWEYGQPTGGTGPTDGSSYNTGYGIPDPASGFSGANVLGYNLRGDYERGISETRWATTPAMDCSSHENLKLRFQRWLGVYYGGSNGDNVYIEVSNDGVNWTQKYHNGNQRVVEAAWVEVEYDISDVADREETVYIRWGMGRTNSSANDDSCGWNIDDVMVFGDYLDTSDLTPPNPSPMTFAIAPTAQGIDTIVMTATTATDYNGVEYYFDETSGNAGGTDSGWQDSPIYSDTGLSPDTQYTYTVQARDKSANANVTVLSSAISVTTPGANTAPVVDAGDDQTAILAASNLWTPDDLSVARWYDAADTDSITTSGGPVSQWNDKSGNLQHATQSNSSIRPVSGSRTINNKNIIGFAKSGNQSMNIPAVDVIGKEVWSVFVLDDFTTTNSQLILGAGGNVQIGVSSSTRKLRLWAATNPFTADSSSVGTVAEDNPVMVGWLAHTDTKKYAINGNLEDTGDAYKEGLTMNASYIGRGQYANMDGAIGELIITNSALAAADRQTMEGYLAHKWGLVNDLPDNHPYVVAPPGGANVVVNLNGTVTDEDGQVPDTIWTTVSGPAFVSFGDASEIDTTASFIETGTYVLRLSADDGTHQVLDEVVITVTLSPLTVAIADANISESGGTTTATISRIGTAGDLEVTLASSDPGEATVPATATIPDGASSVGVTVTGVPDSIVDGTQIVTITASAEGFSDGTDSVGLIDVDGATESFSSWLASYDVGDQTAFGDDPDGDGYCNGVESFLGTDPTSHTPGVTPGTVDRTAGTFIFSHPVNETPASDIRATYRWSKDLSMFYASGQSDGEGSVVTFSPGVPSGGAVDVTATITGAVTDKVFVDIEVTQD